MAKVYLTLCFLSRVKVIKGRGRGKKTPRAGRGLKANLDEGIRWVKMHF